MKCIKPKRLNGFWVLCGKCLSCKFRRRNAWTMRMLHHLQENPDAIFVTLTYQEDQLVKRGNGTMMLVKSDLQKFFKRLRINRWRKGKKGKIEHYSCGEYGERFHRPHYHSIIYGMDLVIDDVRDIHEAWHHGSAQIGSVTPASIRYVAGYIDKKVLGYAAAYEGREPEFQLTSNGIGEEYVAKNFEQMFYDGALKLRDQIYPLSRYYKEKLSEVWPEAYLGLQDRLLEDAIEQEIKLMEELNPMFSGRKYDQLNEAEKTIVADLLYTRNKVYANHFEQKIRLKQKGAYL